MNSKIEAALQEVIDVQCSDGNWNYDPYMHGLANGLILAMGIIKDKDPVFIDFPDDWLKDIPYKSGLLTEDK